MTYKTLVRTSPNATSPNATFAHATFPAETETLQCNVSTNATRYRQTQTYGKQFSKVKFNFTHYSFIQIRCHKTCSPFRFYGSIVFTITLFEMTIKWEKDIQRCIEIAASQRAHTLTYSFKPHRRDVLLYV